MLARIRSGEHVDELLQLDHYWVEIVDSRLVKIEAKASHIHQTIVANLRDILHPFVRMTDLGHVFSCAQAYQLHATEDGPNNTRIADFAFVRMLLSHDYEPGQPYPGAPDLAVEIVPPTGTTVEAMRKAADFFRYGTEEVWLIYPVRQEIHIYRHDSKRPRFYRSGQIFETRDLFPGLGIPVGEVFARRHAAKSG